MKDHSSLFYDSTCSIGTTDQMLIY